MGNIKAGKMSGSRSMPEAANQSGARASSSQHTSTPMARVYRKTDKVSDLETLLHLYADSLDSN
jgi:hypothetical protein